MTPRLGLVAVMVAFLGLTGVARQQVPETTQAPASLDQPRFRGGANLVRVDAYVTVDGAPVADLTAEDFEVLEDNVPQRVESFQLVQPRGPAPATTLREPNTVAESREMARDPEARVFVLFMNVWHVQLEGSYRAQGPLVRLLDRAIGQDDLVGVMTPDMAARTLTLARRRESIEGILKNNWFWGERGRINSSDPRDEQIKQCYPDVDDTTGIAAELIRRKREGQTLDALEALIEHLESIREERKFVFVITEGWLLRGPDQTLARTLKNATGGVSAPPPPQVGVDPQGRMRMDPRDQNNSQGSCERERSMLAFTDHRSQFEHLIQRANRANVSFYPMDPRGLVAFDEPINSSRALTVAGPDAAPLADARRLSDRRDAVRTLAANTDGYAIVDTNNMDPALKRVVDDTGAYYLLGYYSTNTKLDGRFRRLTVRVKREGLNVRARPGYLAPSEAELASSRVAALMNGAAPGHTTIPPSVARAFERLAPIRGVMPFRVQTAASPAQIWVTGELDPATAKSTEWQQGGRVRVTFQHERGDGAPGQSEATLAAGQRAFQVTPPAGARLAPGRHVLRVELTPTDGTVPLQTSAEVVVPDNDWMVSPSALVARRGPSTGLQYVPTADARFRRTERLRLEVPRSAAEGQVFARLLGRDGQALNVAVTLSDRMDGPTDTRLIVADLALAPLAQGDYAIEVSVERGDRKENATYAFRIVP